MLTKQRGILHPLNVLHVKTLDLAFESAINVGKFDEALAFGNELVPGFTLVYLLYVVSYNLNLFIFSLNSIENITAHQIRWSVSCI